MNETCAELQLHLLLLLLVHLVSRTCSHSNPTACSRTPCIAHGFLFCRVESHQLSETLKLERGMEGGESSCDRGKSRGNHWRFTRKRHTSSSHRSNSRRKELGRRRGRSGRRRRRRHD